MSEYCLSPIIKSNNHYFSYKSKDTIKNYYKSKNGFIKETTKICNDFLQLFNIYMNNEIFYPNLCVVFDIDDTLLTNYHFHIDTNNNNETNNNLHSFNNMFGILPVIKLYRILRCYVKIFIISNRPSICLKETIENLKKVGVDYYQQIILQNYPMSQDVFKTEIRKEISKQYTILATIGDQESDFVGGFTGTIVKIPNNLYK